MAWGYRRRRFRRRRWRPRRRWFPRRRYRRRRAFRRRPRRRLFRFRRAFGYRRRTTVRRHRRNRSYKSNVTQWNPSHRIGCKIRGWALVVMAIKDHAQEKAEVFITSKTEPDKYVQCGGGLSFRHWTLGMLWQEHKLARNRWTRSNAGFDLARYFGVKFKFWPHPLIDYLVYWENTFNIPEPQEMTDLHPGVLLNRKHLLVRSLRWRGRRRKLRLPPPPIHTNQWYFQKTWCNIPLAKIGIIPVNFRSPFLHKRNQYGVWIGYQCDLEPPKTLIWSKTDMQTYYGMPSAKAAAKPNGGRRQNLQGTGSVKFTSNTEAWKRRIYYRWWWDDGTDNYVMYNPRHNNPSDGGLNSCEIVKVNMPYWQFFTGLSNITSSSSNLCEPGANPSIYAITWYYDIECTDWHGFMSKETDSGPSDPNSAIFPPQNSKNGVFYPDQDLCGPQYIPVKKGRKYWVLLAQHWPWVNADVSSWHLPDYDEVRSAVNGITGLGPFSLSHEDLAGEWPNFNISYTYTFFWQWGGFRPRPDTTEDPCGVGQDNTPGPSRKRLGLPPEDPSNVHRLTVHPWDLEQNSIYTKECFKRLLSEVYPSLVTDSISDPPLQNQPQDLVPRRAFRETAAEPWPKSESSSGSEDTSEGEAESSGSWSSGGSDQGAAPRSREEKTYRTSPRMEQRRKRKRSEQRVVRRIRQRLDRFLNERKPSVP
ncbi:ORF1 [Grizzly bear anellovirus 9]|nr:ORF1 [Grizzly bear anellovirus 9]